MVKITPRRMMMHNCHMVIDLQYGSTGKGLLAGWLAKRNEYQTVICAFAPNAGHTYLDKERGLEVMTQQLPTGISSPSVRYILLGPGSLINVDTLGKELAKYHQLMRGKKLIIHPSAAIVRDAHVWAEN